jgi:arsenate reductase
MTHDSPLIPDLNATVARLTAEFNLISSERKDLLEELAQFVQSKMEAGQKARLNFICTHNSRRSHLSQIWAQTAAHYYEVEGVECFSGGTEATAFNPRAVSAMANAGFRITKSKDGENPVYKVAFSDTASPVMAFSKKYDDASNPKHDFAAIMTCSHADENCPLIQGASVRIALTYDDPKEFDGTSLETEKYQERVFQIGRELLYAFSKIKSKPN